MAKIFDCHLNVYLFGCSSTNKQRILSGLRAQVFNQVQIQTIGIDLSIAYVQIEDLQVKFQVVKFI